MMPASKAHNEAPPSHGKYLFQLCCYCYIVFRKLVTRAWHFVSQPRRVENSGGMAASQSLRSRAVVGSAEITKGCPDGGGEGGA